MQTIINIIVFILIIGGIIFIHELGHFLTAKLFGVYAPEFSLGMGPKLIGVKRGETEYQLRLLPIGGYVIMAGEADQEENEMMKDIPLERTLKGIHTWKRCVIMLAGVFMNFVLAITLLIGIYATTEVQSTNPIIGTITEDSQASIAGLEEGDVINKITVLGSEYVIASFSDIQTLFSNETLQVEDPDYLDIVLEITRDSQTVNIDSKIVYDSSYDSFILGITPAYVSLSFGNAIKIALMSFQDSALLIFDTLSELVTNSSETISQLSGPAGIYTITAQVTETGSIATILSLMALLSINIGIFNLLPIPGLDGCQVIFALIEGVIGKELPIKIKYALQVAGLALVLGLMLVVTVQDLSRIFG
ncbi:M50 family metallopeptidase [Tannockella kyphosi]|uniref:M50 family metallopeptidase n=1 Tax=Tannockella kyphosi TaxID=2899121 RepID=UPI002011CA5A|nr:site-2 protease family protein [Tannockella kyphosi]